jgi:protein gp37
MADRSAISWTDATFNPWMGCTKVGPGCDNCYALDLVEGRFGRAKWGPGQPRSRTSESNWRKVEIWNSHPEKLIGSAWPGRKPRVFAASLADIFDNEVDPDWRRDFFALVQRTPNLQWLIVTKRIGNVGSMLPADWGAGYPNVMLLITVVNQKEAERDIPKLLNTPAEQRGLSIEPQLGHIHLGYLGWPGGPTRARDGHNALVGARYHDGKMVERLPKLDWVICGGESGPRARAIHPSWARSLRDQCAAVGIPFHFKQWGEYAPYDRGRVDGAVLATPGSTDEPIQRFGKKLAGRKLDGVEHNDFPLGRVQRGEG